jgi:Undecaprenyl-phosphate glucose phosphotransferase
MSTLDTSLGGKSAAPVADFPATPRKSLSLSESIVSGLFGAMDALVLVAVHLFFYTLYVGWGSGNDQTYLAEMFVTVGLTISAFQYMGLYEFNTIVAWPRRMRHMVALIALVALLLVALAFALKISDQFSQTWFFASVVTSALTIGIMRGVGKLLLRSWADKGVLVRNVAIVGASGQARHLIARLNEQDTPWKRIVGIFDDRRTRISRELEGFPVLGNLEDLVAHVRRGRIHDVVISLPWSAEERLVTIINRLRALPVHVYLGSDLIGYHFPRHREELLEGVPVLEIAAAPLAGWSGLVKLIEDKIVAGGVLLMFAPIMLMIAAAIKLDSPGPIFFRQKRYGFNNQLIEVLKFRSMYHHMRDENADKLAEKNDPRVTKVGAFLRRTSLDELPQLINVLKGDMSIVGPRPHAIKAKAAGKLYEEVVAEYAVRHKVKPGLTGWAQVNGWRGETDNEEKILRRVEHDLYYIENWSLWLDIKILLKTLWVGMRSDNAY